MSPGYLNPAVMRAPLIAAEPHSSRGAALVAGLTSKPGHPGR